MVHRERWQQFTDEEVEHLFQVLLRSHNRAEEARTKTSCLLLREAAAEFQLREAVRLQAYGA